MIIFVTQEKHYEWQRNDEWGNGCQNEKDE